MTHSTVLGVVAGLNVFDYKGLLGWGPTQLLFDVFKYTGLLRPTQLLCDPRCVFLKFCNDWATILCVRVSLPVRSTSVFG